ncbi:MAG: peptidoglycan DD-metalloendopeptidase family protein, partial [Acidimicrobiales bacterium]
SAPAAVPRPAPVAGQAGGPVAVAYLPPVDAPVTDAFRPPASPHGAGNRGVDYATAPGAPVRAAAAGQVTFAGPVGSGLHVVVLHADGIRTSYSFLAGVAVRRGQVVAAGDTVGRAGGSLHFGARAGDAYLDPLVLLAGRGGAAVRLVPDDQRAMGPEAAERSGLRRFLSAVGRGAARVGVAAAEWAAEEVVEAAADMAAGSVPGGFTAEELRVLVPAALSTLAAPVRVTRGGWEWWARRDQCTPASVQPPVGGGRRKVVLVAGLGSHSGHDSIDEVDTAGLGYADADRVRFSYRGGTIADQPYDPMDTQVDIRQSGRRLRELLERMHAEDPGVPIDVVAHSQGGMVARAALGSRAPPGVERLTTLASPHQGADIATALVVVGMTRKGKAALEATSVLARAGVAPIDPTSPSVSQLAETSDFVGDLNRRPLPEGVRVTSIGARADVIVPAPRSYLPGATNTVVSPPEWGDHSALPGSEAAHREMALALADLPPTCESFADFLADAVTGELIGTAEDGLGAAVAVRLR